MIITFRCVTLLNKNKQTKIFHKQECQIFPRKLPKVLNKSIKIKIFKCSKWSNLNFNFTLELHRPVFHLAIAKPCQIRTTPFQTSSWSARGPTFVPIHPEFRVVPIPDEFRVVPIPAEFQFVPISVEFQVVKCLRRSRSRRLRRRLRATRRCRFRWSSTPSSSTTTERVPSTPSLVPIKPKNFKSPKMCHCQREVSGRGSKTFQK